MLPAFPRTPHLPHLPNATSDDVIASSDEAAVVFTQPINIEEKIDGASVGMTTKDGQPIIRNRDHILRKGYEKDTAAKKQFASIWNWFYDHRESFEFLAARGPYSVYGEWCLAQHGIFYDRLPDWFIAYDLYDYEHGHFVEPEKTEDLLGQAGFVTAPLIHRGEFDGDYNDLVGYAQDFSDWSSSQREGIYVKVFDAKIVTHRFKLVRPEFVRGALWNPKKLTKNKLAK